MYPCAAATLKVVASFSIIGDMTARVGGDDIDLTVLVGPDADVHVFQADPKRARAVASAQLFIANGRGLDAWASRLIKASGSKATLVNLTDAVTGRPGDPHAWQDVKNALAYVEALRLALATADPKKAFAYDQRASLLHAELLALERQVRTEFQLIPAVRRKAITTHDAFGFLGQAYGVEFIAPLGISTENQPSAKSVARLITQIRKERITAVFLENIADNRLISQIARETGIALGGRLYSDALSPASGPAASYICMMRHNVRLLTEAMAKGS
ncbi:MAG: zinc ABC transporter substrate-binding protein [Micropepsaceae bacterium]